MAATPLLQAIAALDAHPALQAQAGRSLALLAQRAAERAAGFVPRPDLTEALDAHVREASGGLIALEGPPGGGATALLCHLAAARPCALWLPGDDDGGGLVALCAQLVALYRLPLQLVPPAAGRDGAALGQLLAEVGAARPPGDPAVVLVGRSYAQPAHLPAPLPEAIPPGVALVLALSPGERPAHTPPPRARVALPSGGRDLARQIAAHARGLGATPSVAAALAARSQGAFLYPRLALGLLAGRPGRRPLPAGLAALHDAWWAALDIADRRLMLALAAAGEPCDLAAAATAAGMAPEDARARAERWRPFLEHDGARARIYHPATAAFLAERSGDSLARAHAALALVGQRTDHARDPHGYFARQLGRHVALSDPATRAELGPAVASRSWVVAQERHAGGHIAAARDMAWVLRADAADGPPLRAIRSAAIAGSLSLLARAMPPDAPAAALHAAIEQGQPREPTLRRVRAIVDQLPDGRDKAQILRRLGEVCFALRMKASAMRMLSEALDLEAPGLPRSWHDEREETLVALARAAIAAGSPDIALGITTRIVHAERRGMIETEVVRHLLAHAQLTRAEEVAYAIGHAGNHEWAMAEVAVAHARAGDYERAGTVLGTLRTETAVAWVSAEIACEAARRGNPRAMDRVAMLPGRALRDRALAQVALAMVEGGLGAAAIDVARMVLDDEVRARALVDLAMAYPPLAAEALDEASQSVGSVATDEQAPLVAALAAGQAAMGRPEDALRTASVLPEGEGRDRAQSRIAVALARAGDFAGAEAVAAAIADDDERDWALDELARLLGASGAWREALHLAGQILAAEQRARTEADLAIGMARAGEPAAAHARARQIALPAESLRAAIAIATPLAAAGARGHVFEAVALFQPPETRARYQAAAAGALAAAGAHAEARAMSDSIGRPLDRARALVALARAHAHADPDAALAALSEALVITAALGRRETFLCLSWAADTLAAAAGADLLLAAAGVLDEIDSWWG